MSVAVLQIIAMVTMLIDHIGAVFMDSAIPWRAVGRFAFPIYAFLLAEGFRHIRHDPARVESHLKGYVVLTLVSEVCYDLMETKPFTVEAARESQSVMVTLLLAFLGLLAIERWRDSPVCVGAAVLLTAFACWAVLSNYRFGGVLLVYGCYWYLEHVLDKPYHVRLLALLGVMAGYLAVYHWARYEFCTGDVYLAKLRTANAIWYTMHVPIAILLAFYKGERGPRNKVYQTFYKCFYPAHMLVIGLLHQFTEL